MFRKIFAIALILVLVALCTRKPPANPIAEKLPNTCSAAQFASAVDGFSAMEAQRSEVLARLEGVPTDEPAEYVRLWDREKSAMAEVFARAQGVGVPRCLQNARELFLHYLAKTQSAVDLRSPDSDFVDYRRERETADSIHSQYAAEVRLQEKNRE